MFQLAGFQVFYMSCMGLGFVYLAGSLALSGIGGRGGGRGGGAKAGVRGGGAKIAARGGGAKVGTQGGGTRGGTKASGARINSPAKINAQGGPKAAVRGSGSKVTSGKVPARGGKSSAPKADLTDAVSGSLESVSSKTTDSHLFENVYLAFLGVFNPMFLSLFLFGFGASGLVIERALRITEDLGMAVAAAAALFIAFQLQNFMGWFSAKLECSTVESVDDNLGSTGEVTITIPQGKFGEITLVVGLTKTNYPAKAYDPDLTIKKGTQVFVVELEQGIAIVDVLEPDS